VSEKRKQFKAPETKREAPKYIVSYSAMMTILLAFFIMLNSLATVQEGGLKGAGLGLFKMSFNSIGLPGLLSGARKPVGLNAPGGKHMLSADEDEKAEGKKFDGRLIDPDKRDLKQALATLLKTRNDVVLPLNIRHKTKLSAKAKKQLAEIARLLRQSDNEIMVCATVPERGRETRHAWQDASSWALLVARHLNREERIDSDRLIAVGYAALPPGEASTDPLDTEPTMSLILRPQRGSLMTSQPEYPSLRNIHFRKSTVAEQVTKPNTEE